MKARWLPRGLAAILCLVHGCRLAGPCFEARLALPPLPPDWEAAFDEVSYEVRAASACGAPLALLFPSWAAGTTEIVVDLPSHAYSPVVVTPLVGAWAIRLRPAGAIFPLDVQADGRTLAVSWERGAAAALVERLLGEASARGIPHGELNVERLARDMEQRGDGDAWNVDADALIAAIIEGGGRSWTCRRLSTRRLVIPASELPGGPEVRGYVLDNALAAPACLSAAEDGTETLVLEAIPAGFHRLFPCVAPAEAAREWLDIGVSQFDAVWVLRAESE